ncbi:MAG: FHA domain-containing serine/threonine-protein kinase [Planctomycetota bacterium]
MLLNNQENFSIPEKSIDIPIELVTRFSDFINKCSQGRKSKDTNYLLKESIYVPIENIHHLNSILEKKLAEEKAKLAPKNIVGPKLPKTLSIPIEQIKNFVDSPQLDIAGTLKKKNRNTTKVVNIPEKIKKDLDEIPTVPNLELAVIYEEFFDAFKNYQTKQSLTKKLYVEPTQRYELIEKISSGGFGEVFKCFDTKLQREVAIKKSFRSLEKEEIEKFQKEARVIAQLNHPNIVQVYDFEIDEKYVPSIVMEMITGENIASRFTDRNEKDFILKVIKVFSEIADAISYIHEKNIFHLDIKPKNILITQNGIAKLVDFGLASIVKNVALTATKFNGTPQFAAPEQFGLGTKFKPNPSTDIYSLGASLYNVLTGLNINPGENLYEIIKNLYDRKMGNNLSFGEEIDQKLRKICLTCTEFEMKNRYQSAKELFLDLTYYCGEISKTNNYPCLYMVDRNKNTRFLFSLAKYKQYIGRSFGNDIVIQNKSISRVHAMIQVEGDVVSIENMSQIPIKIGEKELLCHQEVILSENSSIHICGYEFFYMPVRKGSDYDIQEEIQQGKSPELILLSEAQKLLNMNSQTMKNAIRQHKLKTISKNKKLIATMWKKEWKDDFKKKVIPQNLQVAINQSLPLEERFPSNSRLLLVEIEPERKWKSKGNLGLFLEYDPSTQILNIYKNSHTYLSKNEINQIIAEEAIEGTLITTQDLSKTPLPDLAAYLLFTNGSDFPCKKPLGKITSFGSNPSCEYYLPKAKPKQAVILQEENGFLLKNLLSENSILLNGKKFQEAILRSGDCFKIANDEYHFFIGLPI